MSRTSILVFPVFLAFLSPASAETVLFNTLGTFTAPDLNNGGVTVTGSDSIHVLQLNGLGIVGGLNDNTVDTVEYIEFSYPIGAIDISYYISFTGNNDNDDTTGDRILEAFAVGGASLGPIFQSGGGGMLPVSSHYGNQPIERFVLTPQGDSFRVGSVTFTTIPEPATATLALVALCLAMKRNR